MSEQVDRLLKGTTEWLRGTGPEADVVVSSRIRLARNLAGFPFIAKLAKEQEDEIIDLMEEAVNQTPALKDNLFIKYRDVTEDMADYKYLAVNEYMAINKYMAVNKCSVNKNSCQQIWLPEICGCQKYILQSPKIWLSTNMWL